MKKLFQLFRKKRDVQVSDVKEKPILGVKRKYHDNYSGNDYWEIYISYENPEDVYNWLERDKWTLHKKYNKGEGDFHDEYYRLVELAMKNNQEIRSKSGNPVPDEIISHEKERIHFQKEIDSAKWREDCANKRERESWQELRDNGEKINKLEEEIAVLLDIKEKHYTLLRIIELPKRTLEKFKIP